MTWPAGTRLGPSEIPAPIGAGGMGEVYRSRHTRLDRDVAIKILAPAFADDAGRLMRFTREAKTRASLNHPHIAQIHGVEQMPDEDPGLKTCATVMDLVDGEDLPARIARGPIPVVETLAIARQVAEALEAAHEQGIIHRDLFDPPYAPTPDGQRFLVNAPAAPEPVTLIQLPRGQRAR